MGSQLGKSGSTGLGTDRARAKPKEPVYALGSLLACDLAFLGVEVENRG